MLSMIHRAMPSRCPSTSVALGGPPEWKTESFALKGAWFANSQNGKADFRVVVTTSGRFYLRRVACGA